MSAREDGVCPAEGKSLSEQRIVALRIDSLIRLIARLGYTQERTYPRVYT